MERLNQSEYESCRQELLFEIEHIAIESLIKQIEIEEQAKRDIEDIEEAWYQDTLEEL